MSERPTTAEVLVAAKEYYRKGGELPNVFGNGKITDQVINQEKRLCREEGDPEGYELANLMLQLSKTGRNKVIKSLKT